MSVIEKAVHHHKDLTTITISGNVDTKTLSDTVILAYQEEPTEKVLVDFSLYSMDEMATGELQHVLEQIKAYTRNRTGGKTALVFNSETGLDVGIRFCLLAQLESLTISLKSFSQPAAALRWLNQ